MGRRRRALRRAVEADFARHAVRAVTAASVTGCVARQVSPRPFLAAASAAASSAELLGELLAAASHGGSSARRPPPGARQHLLVNGASQRRLLWQRLLDGCSTTLLAPRPAASVLTPRLLGLLALSLGTLGRLFGVTGGLVQPQRRRRLLLTRRLAASSAAAAWRPPLRPAPWPLARLRPVRVVARRRS